MRGPTWLICTVILLEAGQAAAQTPTCDRLTGEKKKLAAEILGSQHPYDCCDRTIALCLKRDPVCSLAWRLAENVCRRVDSGQEQQVIVRGLSRRARSMLPSGKKATIDLTGSPVAGAPDAPVVLVEFACARCPFCAKITPALHKAVTEGALQGKVGFHFKVFPIRSHEYSKETGMGFMAAHELSAFWAFVLLSYERFDAFCIDKQAAWAADAEMDPQAFTRLTNDARIRKRLVDSKKEGILNKVDATPTFFINGRRYDGDLDLEELVDVLAEEHERVMGVAYRGGRSQKENSPPENVR